MPYALDLFNVKHVVIDHASSGDNTVVAAVTDKRIVVISGALISSGTCTVRFESGAGGTALTGQMSTLEATGFLSVPNTSGHFTTAVGELLNLEISGAVSVDGWLNYIEVG